MHTDTSTCSKSNTSHSELFTQMEPLFPQCATIHEAPKKYYCSTETAITEGAHTDLKIKNNSHSPEHMLNHPGVKVCVHQPQHDSNDKDKNAKLPSIEVQFNQPFRNTSTNGTHEITPSRAALNSSENRPGVQNVQLLKIVDSPTTSVSYLPPSEGRIRSKNLVTRPQIASRPAFNESDLEYKRVTSVVDPPGRSGYSARRERLKQEREHELLMRQRRQLAASSTGLNEQQSHYQSRHQQQYRSLSAVNTGGMSDVLEERETITLQPIGRGVQDIDSRTGSMTTLPRGPGGSLMDGLNRVDDTERSGLTRRGYSSTQFLSRNTPTSELIRPIPVHQSQNMIVSGGNSQSLCSPTGTFANTQVNPLNGSRSQLSTTSSTLVAPSATNGWKSEQSTKNCNDTVDHTNLGIVQETAPSWYRPNLSRETAISILRQQPPGSFLIRDSTTFKGAFGLAVKVATLPPKVTPKSDDLQSELVRHYLIEVVNTPPKGVRLKGFASEPVFPSLAALIHHHTYDPLALPCRLILPPVPTNLPSSGTAALPPLVIGGNDMTHVSTTNVSSSVGDMTLPDNNTTLKTNNSTSGFGHTATASEVGSTRMSAIHQPNVSAHMNHNTVASQHVPFVCVLRESPPHQRRSPMDTNVGQGLTFRCLMLGCVDTPQWDNEVCFARAVDQLIPLTVLTAAECDHGVSRVRYTEVQLHVSSHDGITIIDLQRRLFLRRHLPNHILMYCGLEPRKKEFQHPEHEAQGIVHPQIFGIISRKGISECTTHIFSECDPAHTANAIVQHIRNTYPHLNVQ